MGDWNADILNSRDSDTRFLLTLMNDLSLKLVNTGPSHHSSETNTWIDSIFVDNCDTILHFDRSLPNFPSRHDVISVTINMFYPSPPEVNTTYKAFSKILALDLNSHLHNLD